MRAAGVAVIAGQAEGLPVQEAGGTVENGWKRCSAMPLRNLTPAQMGRFCGRPSCNVTSKICGILSNGAICCAMRIRTQRRTERHQTTLGDNAGFVSAIRALCIHAGYRGILLSCSKWRNADEA